MKIAASNVIGLALLPVAVLVMAGWLLRSRPLVAAIPGAHMVFNTALCFALAGLALAAESFARATLARRTRAVLGVAIAAIAALVFAQDLSGRDLGIDLPLLHDWLPDDNPHPGRMAPPTALAFVLAGLALASMDRVTGVWSGVAVQAMTAGIVLLGGIGLAGYALDFSLLYTEYPFRQMAIHTAVAFLLAATALWLAWRRMSWYRDRSLIRDEAQRIALMAAAILALIVCGSLLGVFAITSSQLKASAQTGLLESLKSRIDLVRISLDSRSVRAAVIATRPSLVEQLAMLEQHPFEPRAQERLRAEAESALQLGFSAVAFYGLHGEARGAAGRRTEQPTLVLSIDGAPRLALLWEDGFVLYSRLTVERDGKPVGVMVAEQKLTAVTEALRSADDFAASAEIVVCRRSADQLDCVRQRPEPPVFHVPFASSLPIARAFENHTGVDTGRDYRGERVIAAHGPVGRTGLAMVLKIDAAELYAPVRRQMYLALALMSAMVAAGVWLLRRRIAPLVRRLARSEQRLALALEGSRLALWDYDVAANTIFLDERWGLMLGGDAQALNTTPHELMALVHPEDVPALRDHVREVIRGAASHYDIEHRVRTRSGEWLWIRSRGRVVERDRRGRALRLAGTNADIQQRKLAELQLAHQAGHDALSGLPNRNLFHDRIRRAIARSRRHDALLAVMYLDIDKFKSINDTLGHDIGDALIREFARRLVECVRNTDTVARFGGDEFAVILEELEDRDAGLQIAQKIVAAMRAPFVCGEREIAVSTSVGIAFHGGSGAIDIDRLLKQADRALYQAKAAGRNTYCVSEEAAAYSP